MFIVFFAILCFLVAFRNNTVGADTQNYLYHYTQISQLDYNNLSKYGYEIGYVVFVKIISNIFHTYEAYKISIALIGTSASAYFYCKKSNSPISTIMMLATFGDLFGNFSGGRQTITTAIVLISFTFVEHEKLMKFFLSVVLAALFHNSAWFALLLYPAYQIKLPRKMTPLLLLPVGILFVFRRGIFTMMLRFANTKYFDAYGHLSSTGAYSTFIFLFALSLFVIFLIYGGNSEESYTAGIVNILLLATVIQMFTSVAHGITRINSYFVPFVPIAIEEAAKKASPKYLNIARVGRFIICTFLILYLIINIHGILEGYKIIPYSFCWD